MGGLSWRFLLGACLLAALVGGLIGVSCRWLWLP